MADLTVQKIVRGGLGPTYQAADAAGDRFPGSSRRFLHTKNGGAGAITVTLNSQKTCDQGFDHDENVSVPAGGERMVGPFSDRFYDPTGYVNVTYSGVTSVTVAAVEA